ncbi:hypothetical protein [Nonomuraea sp. NPDC049480]|uniref:hypothetical protein n=1 Tax=Nonomuraea sp. NPDC049480 TaxID=3364353 RepID=UPI0037AB4691
MTPSVPPDGQEAVPPAGGSDAITVLLDASRRYATHVRLLVDQLAQTRPDADDGGLIEDALYEVTEAAAMARRAGDSPSHPTPVFQARGAWGAA